VIDDYALHEIFRDGFDDLPDDAKQIILNIGRAVREGGYEVLREPREVLSRPLAPDGLWGDEDHNFWRDKNSASVHSSRGTLRPARVSGPSSAINIIPPPRGVPGFCCPIVAAIAYGRRPPGGLAMVLRLLRQHLIHCGTGHAALFNRTAILVTNHWDRRLVYESEFDLRSHAQAGGLRTAILHWDGRRWWRQRI
jgi:hypothetical protein